jgi:hypothetical protein
VADDGTEQVRMVEGRRIYARNSFKAPELRLAKGLRTLTFGTPLPREDQQRHAIRATNLSHEQQTALASLLASEVLRHIEAIWRMDTIDDLLSERGLPSTREALRSYLVQARREQT